jgi:CRISPR-associated protein Cas2
MTVIVANDVPPAIRGILKRWFIEPRPNVFVGTVNTRIRQKVIAYVRRNAPGLGMLVIGADNSVQGFSIDQFGETNRRPHCECGLHLIAESWADQVDCETENE